MSALRRAFCLLLAMALASAHASVARSQSTPAEASSRSGEAALEPVKHPDEVMTLPPALKSRLRETLGTGPEPAKLRLERLLRFIVDDSGLGIRYGENATYSVAQTYETRRANCVGFTLLLIALAREAGLDAYPQGIVHTLAWRKDDRTLYRSNHVNAGVAIGARTQVVDFSIEPVIARDPPSRISDRRLLAHYYNNLAMAKLSDGDTAVAQRLMRIALDLDADYAPHWSNAGVLHLRGGDTDAAERAYARALTLDPHESSALFNMASLARRIGDAKKEAEYQRRLSRVQQQDPFHHFLQALAYEHSGDDARAIERYLAAIRLHKKEHRFHAALSQAYRRTGDIASADRALKRARALSKGAARDAYDSELKTLAALQRRADSK
jgi:Flp pilus assembly protein TadD